MKKILMATCLLFAPILVSAQTSFQFFNSSIAALGTVTGSMAGDFAADSLTLLYGSSVNKVLTSDGAGNASWQALIPENRETVVVPSGGQSVFQTTGAFSADGSGLKVYVDGALKSTDTYTVDSTQQITFLAPLAENQILVMLWGYYSPVGAASGDLDGTYPNPTVNRAINLTGGAAGKIPYQTGPSQTLYTNVGTSGYVLSSNGASAPTWTNQVTNLAGGFAGKIPYQEAAGTTAMLSAGTAGYVLTGQGAAAPIWVQATNTNIANTIVKRGASGNFNCGAISLTGGLTASGTVSAVTINASGSVISNGGSTTIYYCTAGANAGNLCRGNGCSCPDGYWYDSGLRIP